MGRRGGAAIDHWNIVKSLRGSDAVIALAFIPHPPRAGPPGSSGLEDSALAIQPSLRAERLAEGDHPCSKRLLAFVATRSCAWLLLFQPN